MKSVLPLSREINYHLFSNNQGSYLGIKTFVICSLFDSHYGASLGFPHGSTTVTQW